MGAFADLALRFHPDRVGHCHCNMEITAQHFTDGGIHFCDVFALVEKPEGNEVALYSRLYYVCGL